MIKIENKENVIYVYVEGHIDSSNAPQFEKEVFECAEIKTCENVIIDASALEYISSAGLRVILKIRKQFPDMKIIGVNSSVYEIFDMTGFTDMIKVEKAYKQMSVEGCEVLGEGANGIVYRCDNDTVVKVYKNPDALDEIHRERELAKKALILGIPTAISYDVVKVGKGYASVFELLNAKSFSKLIRENPEDVDKYIKEYVELLKLIHSTKVDKDGMDDMKVTALSWVDYLKGHIPDAQFEKLKDLINALPDTDTLIHGDYHLNNVENQNGEVLLIDMDTLAYGHPIFELAPMYLAYVAFGDVDRSAVENFFKLPFETAYYIWRKSLSLYLDTDDEERIQDVENKVKVIGYTRLLRRTIKRYGTDNEESKKLIKNCKDKLNELLPIIDTLDF